MDAKEEPPWKGSRRLCVQYRLQAAWRFDLSDLLEAGGENYYPVKGVAHISNLKLPQVTQVQN
ncbi:hypothetical protein GCM10010919_16080 [Alishewanella longhuensis]|uniref:Uncharacterized protein n=1 Tax=Alishewanella longhuensis TaxID=1091037 RepID=A0ABQ3KX55_9ALTE|nr:hypothetical protein GCM10010919_16080 [Alishewanella longhuensis]